MTPYVLKTKLAMDDGTAQQVPVVFKRHVPELLCDWHDSSRGCLHIKKVKLHAAWRQHNTLLVIEHIQLRRACWMYLDLILVKKTHQ